MWGGRKLQISVNVYGLNEHNVAWSETKNVPSRLVLTGDIKIFMRTNIWGTELASSGSMCFMCILL